MRVLVVDDDVVVHMTLGIAWRGVELHEAHRAAEAADTAAVCRPEAVVVDVRLPDGDGLQVVKQLRRLPATAEVPIVVLTAAHDPGRRVVALAAGADEYMAKPFEPEDLLALLQRLLLIPSGERRVRRTLHRARIGAGRQSSSSDDLPTLPEDEAADRRPAGRFRGRRRR